jgi:hypothetical protein
MIATAIALYLLAQPVDAFGLLPDAAEGRWIVEYDVPTTFGPPPGPNFHRSAECCFQTRAECRRSPTYKFGIRPACSSVAQPMKSERWGVYWLDNHGHWNRGRATEGQSVFDSQLKCEAAIAEWNKQFAPGASSETCVSLTEAE